MIFVEGEHLPPGGLELGPGAGLGAMYGNYAATQLVGPSPGPGLPGFNAHHPILCGIDKLYEGVSIAGR